MKDRSMLGCAVNLSEGTDLPLLQRVAEEAAGCAHVLDLSSDPDHNRTVLTLCGRPSPLVDGIVRAARMVVAHVDLHTHQGVHPRTGAVDVVPFYPIRDTPMEAAVAAARLCAGRLWAELGVPSFLYEEAATSPESRALPWIRRFAFVTRAPDVGGPEPHPTAGAAVVGARGLLVAYNVDLDSDDVEVAREIAMSIRRQCAGRARTLGLYLPSRRTAQVSMNILLPEQLTLSEAFDAVATEAAVRGVGVKDSEVVGLVPRDCLGDDPARLRLRQQPRVMEDLIDPLFAA
ncbi:MAG TPA: glutamate formimidoyltransferase [Actinomycetota bacterium]|nr:glutamate formimidoyltransferase [Actinomycetota bacterium]